MQKKVFTVDEIKKKLEYYCVYQDRCHWEVEKKMLEYSLIPQAKEIVLLHLLEHDFLNEERFAKSYSRGKFRVKKWGKRRIVLELKQRQISEYNIKQALLEIDEKEYFETLKNIIDSKNKTLKEANSYKRRQKIFQFAYNRGFESELINEVLKVSFGQ